MQFMAFPDGAALKWTIFAWSENVFPANTLLPGRQQTKIIAKNMIKRNGEPRKNTPRTQGGTGQTRPKTNAAHHSSQGNNRTDGGKINFGNKKSVFLSKEKREAIVRAEKRETEKRSEQQQRHASYEGRYEDRVRSSSNLSKERLVKKRPEKTTAYKRPSRTPEKKDEREGIRLNKFIAHSGVCSRRDADMYIRSGSVQVNGQVITEMGHKVLPTDVVKFDGTELKTEKTVYVLLNKPKNYITTTDDPEKRRTVMELVKNAGKERIYPVGRLDRSTMGLLLFTNDGQMAKSIMHPSSNIKKTYHVTLDRTLTANDMSKIRQGIELEDGEIIVDSISYIPEASHKEVGVELHSGRNRIVRRIFEHLGYEVVKLDRVQLGPLTKKNLARGQWRFLTQQEINILRMVASGKKTEGNFTDYGLE